MPPQCHPTASINSAPLFLGEFTTLLTGQTFGTSSPAGSYERNLIALAQPQRPIVHFRDHRHCGHESSPSVVISVNVRVTMLSGRLNPSYSPANATG